MLIKEAKRQRRLIRFKNQILHEQRLRIPRMRIPNNPDTNVSLSWWQRLLRYFKSFFDAKPKLTI